MCLCGFKSHLLQERNRNIEICSYQTVDKVPGKSPGFSFIMFSTFQILFYRFTKKKIHLSTLFFKGFEALHDIIMVSGGSAYDDEKRR